MEYIEKICKSIGCKEYIEWNCGYGDCVSCLLQGQSYSIDQIADNCPYKDRFTKSKTSSMEEGMWLARDIYGLYLYIGEVPIKSLVYNTWDYDPKRTRAFELPDSLFPEVKWSDSEPTKVKLEIVK